MNGYIVKYVSDGVVKTNDGVVSEGHARAVACDLVLSDGINQAIVLDEEALELAVYRCARVYATPAGEWPPIGGYVREGDALYRMRVMAGLIKTGDGKGNYVLAAVETADWWDVDHPDPDFLCEVEGGAVEPTDEDDEDDEDEDAVEPDRAHPWDRVWSVMDETGVWLGEGMTRRGAMSLATEHVARRAGACAEVSSTEGDVYEFRGE